MSQQLDRIEAKLDLLLLSTLGEVLMFDQLHTDLTANGSAVDSAVQLLTGLKASLDAAIASGDPAQLTALSAQLEANTQRLASAVVANTPAAPSTTQPAGT